MDASAVVEFLLGTPSGRAVRRHLFHEGTHEPALHAPSLLDAEVAQVFRRLEARGEISSDRAHSAMRTLMDLSVERHHLVALLPRVWQLRRNLTAYDAAYLALAEGLACPLLTFDRLLARASESRVPVIVPEAT